MSIRQQIPNLILIGYRATGKTTVAQRIGEILRISVFDSDREIERRTGKSIAEIFAEQGEAGFRELEAETIFDLIEKNRQNNEPFILSTGGGAVLRPETRTRLREAGHVVWLTTSAEIILQRMQGDSTNASTRPSLTSLPPLDEILALLEFRSPLYQEASHQTISSEQHDPESIARKIIEHSVRKRQSDEK